MTKLPPGLSGPQMAAVLDAAETLTLVERSALLQSIGSWLRSCHGHPTEHEFAQALRSLRSELSSRPMEGDRPNVHVVEASVAKRRRA